MIRPLAVAALVTLSTAAFAQQSSPPTPLYPGAAPRSIEPEPLPPLPPAATAPPAASSPSPPPAATPPPVAPPRRIARPGTVRVFCDQQVAVQLADPFTLPDPYRRFVGVWSDASWTPQLCAALIVESVEADGTASIVYVFGPMGSNTRQAGGVLHGTGVVRDGELRFQNSDGSQFAFRPLYADLDGRLTTPQGQTYQAVFKKTI